VRPLCVGGVPKEALLTRLNEAGILLNEAARTLFADARFAPASVPALVESVEVSVADLGLTEGATFADIVERAAIQGLTPCPLELGVHLRLELVDQPEGALGQPVWTHRAPPGAITVASPPLATDDDVPKGFYLRRIEGDLWLRGYRSGPEHRWSADDVFVFRRGAATP
jgi:hypothetical protein